MPKKSTGNARKQIQPDVDDGIFNDTQLLTNKINESNDICREIVETCSNSAILCIHKKTQNDIECKQAATDILNGFNYYNKWCYMNKDEGENDLDNWKQDDIPSKIVPDSWSSNVIPIRKIIQKKEEIFEIKPATHSKTNSVRSAQSNRSRLSRRSLRSQLKRSSIDLKKPLTNIMDNDENNENIQIIKLNNINEIKDTNKINKNKRNLKNRNRKKSIINNKSSTSNNQKKDDTFSINLKQKQKKNQNLQKNSMNISLKTGRLSMKTVNAYKYHPNKPFTYDHTGQKMFVIPIKPDKIPNNIVKPIVTFNETEMDHKVDKIEKKAKKKNGKTTRRGNNKNRKKTNNKKKSKSKSIQQPIFFTSSVPVQPPIESIMKVESGVSLKTKNTTIKGTEKKKYNIKNLSRSEYNKYIETLKNVTQTQVFDTQTNSQTSLNKNNQDLQQKNDENANNNNMANNTNKNNPMINTQRTTSSISHRSPLSREQRMRAKSPTSIKKIRGLMSQHTDRLISNHNKNSLLPRIKTLDERYSLSTSTSKNKLNRRKQHQQYVRKFGVKSPKAKIKKSKLGKALFGPK